MKQARRDGERICTRAPATVFLQLLFHPELPTTASSPLLKTPAQSRGRQACQQLRCQSKTFCQWSQHAFWCILSKRMPLHPPANKYNTQNSAQSLLRLPHRSCGYPTGAQASPFCPQASQLLPRVFYYCLQMSQMLTPGWQDGLQQQAGSTLL